MIDKEESEKSFEKSEKERHDRIVDIISNLMTIAALVTWLIVVLNKN